MIDFPNAKINLGLNILERRIDGFHNIESLIIPIKHSDILEIIPTECGQDSFESTGITIPSNGKPNLCQQAQALLKEKYQLPSLSIHLHKIIPAGSGLGGGSSDGAFTLKLIDNILSLGLSNEALKQLAAELGSDCPFFIENKTTFVTERGEIMEPFSLNLSGLYLAIVIPRFHISTADAYAGVKPGIPSIPLREVLSSPIEKWKKILKNDFEEFSFRKFPLLAQIKKGLYRHGALYASMSGSGSAMFGLFENHPGIQIQKSFPEALVWIEEIY